MSKTNIEWTDETWNPVRGCSRVSTGCQNCYAEKVAFRFKGTGLPYEGLLAKGGQWNGSIKLVPEQLLKPLSWKKPRKIFVNSMSDLFHEKVPTEFIDQIFAVMALASQHTFQILTKRPERMLAYLTDPERAEAIGHAESYIFEKFSYTKDRIPVGKYYGPVHRHELWPLPNVWLGVSVENQETADQRIPLLLKTPAAVRWISVEPLLGAISLEHLPRPTAFHTSPYGWTNWLGQHLHWVVAGGESGSNARPMHPDWVRLLRDHCAGMGIAFLFKQWGEWSYFANEAHYTHGNEEKQPHAWVDSETGDWGYCWPIDSDGMWSNHSGNPRQRAPESEYLHDAITIMGKNGKKSAGRLLDGVLHDEYPSSQLVDKESYL